MNLSNDVDINQVIEQEANRSVVGILFIEALEQAKEHNGQAQFERNQPENAANSFPLPSLKKQMERQKFTLNKPGLFSMVVEENNMAPTYQKGDIIVIDPNHRLTHDGIFLIRMRDQLFVTRVQLIHKGYRFINDNPKHNNVLVAKDDDFSVIGHVEWQLNKTYR
ncbi:S24 family peptidase [Thalassotalea sp. ND16A]|uniref:S24 family peptidase n=1 Tax=Thalassotalea sp. ND16A TaxID=1535422 RepID=UPI00051A8083|nr:S24 family peptidase [Thalassotalea sp. ND16A]KGJ98129.1 hypothetical protein ND16A_0934 [Thalassotalea sp. ND16A]